MYALATLSAFLMRDVLRYRVRVARDNLRRALPELSETERRRILRRHYQVFAEVLFELPRVAVMSPAELRARVTVAGVETVHAEYALGRSTLLLIGHQCNWEWLLQAVALAIGVPFLAAYKPPHSAYADRLMLGLRGRFGVRMVPGKRLLREVLRWRGTVHAVGMVADQMPTSSPGRVWLRFLGRETAFFPGAGGNRARRGLQRVLHAIAARAARSLRIALRAAGGRGRAAGSRGIHGPLRRAARGHDQGLPGRLGLDAPPLETAAAGRHRRAAVAAGTASIAVRPKCRDRKSRH